MNNESDFGGLEPSVSSQNLGRNLVSEYSNSDYSFDTQSSSSESIYEQKSVQIVAGSRRDSILNKS